MSRGVGALQRRILETLDEARAAKPSYRGAELAWEMSPGGRIRTTDYAWTRLGAMVVVLAPGVYDLRCSAAYLAAQDGHETSHGWRLPSFTASFARATRGLVRHGVLVRLIDVPVAQVIIPRHSQQTFVRWPSRQLRFVTLSANPVGLTLRGNQPPDAEGVLR